MNGSYSTKTHQIAWDIVAGYAQYDHESDSYTISLQDIPGRELDVLQAAIMQDDPHYASAVCGPDNDNFTKTMLPALTRYLQKPESVDRKLNFMDAWREGIRHWGCVAEELIEGQLFMYNLAKGDAA